MRAVFAERVARWADTDRIALTADDRTLTYASWRRDGDALARGLAAIGLARPARVATLLPNGPELLTTLYACSRVGLSMVPISTWATTAELGRILAGATPDLLLTADTFPAHIARVADLLGVDGGLRRDRVYAWGETAGKLHEVADLLGLGRSLTDQEWQSATTAAGEDADLVTLYTSGSTGQPKGVFLQQGAVSRNGALIAQRMGFGSAERIYTYFPLFFSGGLCNALSGSVSVGGELVTQARFDPNSAAELIRARRCTSRHVWHDGLEAIAGAPGFSPGDLARMRRGLFVDQSLLGRLGLAHDEGVNMYGMTETATAFTCGDYRDSPEVRAAGHGRVLPGNELRILDPDSQRPLDAGELGEICVRGPNMMRGYSDGSHLGLIDDDGYFHTGDLGHLSEDGELRYVGRTKTLIKVKGLTVQPEEVEAVLASHSAVTLAAVAGLGSGDESTGIAALVELEAGASVDTDALVRHCRRELSSYKVPRIRIVAEGGIPRNASLKIDRQAVRGLLVNDTQITIGRFS